MRLEQCICICFVRIKCFLCYEGDELEERDYVWHRSLYFAECGCAVAGGVRLCLYLGLND